MSLEAKACNIFASSIIAKDSEKAIAEPRLQSLRQYSTRTRVKFGWPFGGEASGHRLGGVDMAQTERDFRLVPVDQAIRVQLVGGAVANAAAGQIDGAKTAAARV